MAEVLQFDVSLAKGGFSLSAAAEIPLTGITAISGPSGSGKTTLLRVLAGLETATQGQIRFASEDWSRMKAAKRGVGYVFQDAQLFPHLSVAGNLEYGAIRRGASENLLSAVIEALDLRAMLDRAPSTLSGGESRRVALGRALASAPRILLMDEPLAGLDRARKADLMPYIARAVAGFDVPAIYVTHSAMEIGFLADRTLFIEDGHFTAWSGAAPRLIGQVINVAPGQVNIAVGELSLWLDGAGTVGETWALPIGQDFVIATENPGVSNSTLTLGARVVDASPGSGSCQVEISGQHLALPWNRNDGAAPRIDSKIWLLIPRLMGRPVQFERANDS